MKVAVELTRPEWAVVLAAVEGFQVQLYALVGPMADAGRPRSMQAVRVLGELRWIHAELRRAAGETE